MKIWIALPLWGITVIAVSVWIYGGLVKLSVHGSGC